MSTRTLLPMSQRSPNGIIISGSGNKSVLRHNEKILFFGAIIAFSVFCFLGLYMLPDMKPGKMMKYLNADNLAPNLLGLPVNDGPQGEGGSGGVLPRPQGREEDALRLREKIQEQQWKDQHDAVIPKPNELPPKKDPLAVPETDNKEAVNSDNNQNNYQNDNQNADEQNNDNAQDADAGNPMLKNHGVITVKKGGYYRGWTPDPMPAGVDSDPEVAKKQAHVKQMAINSWDQYRRYAWGENELRPKSKMGHSNSIFGASKLGATIVDGMDTLWIMGLKDRFKEGRDWIDKEFDITKVETRMSVFETIIRFVGGFLTCYSLTGDEMFLNKAVQVADKLLPAFDTPTGIPMSLINPKNGAANNYAWASNSNSILSEIGTLYLEFAYLSAVTGNPIYLEKVENIRRVLDEAKKTDGLYPNYISPKTGKWGQVHVSLGALGDSFYEYLLKIWIMSGKTDEIASRMYSEAAEAVDKKLVQTSKSGLRYLADLRYNRLEHKMGHLACFAAGMFSLGANLTVHSSPQKNANFMKLGEDLGFTCQESYRKTETGIGPEVFWFSGEYDATPMKTNDEYYILRPEVIEGWFYLWRLTHDNKYRDWAWAAVQSIEKYCLVEQNGAYAGIHHVNNRAAPEQDDVQQSFWLAETLKYLYLIFSSDDLVSLDQWVFNTEAHPLPIRGKNSAFPPAV